MVVDSVSGDKRGEKGTMKNNYNRRFLLEIDHKRSFGGMGMSGAGGENEGNKSSGREGRKEH